MDLKKLKDWEGATLDTDKFLKKYSPWHREKGTKIIEDFLKPDNKVFSWLNILKGNEICENGYEKIPANVHYGIPNHVIGNFDQANLFLCLINPNIEFEDKFKASEHVSSKRIKNKKNISEYYEEFKKVGANDPTSHLNNFKDVKSLRNHIVNRNKNIIQLESEFDVPEGDGYYIKNYFKGVLKEIKDENYNLGKLKICNLELYPFRSRIPGKFMQNLLRTNDDIVLLTARIILRRIAKFLNNDEKKLKFIFRRYDDAEMDKKNNRLKYDRMHRGRLAYVLEKDLGYEGKDIDEILTYIEKEYFYYLYEKDFTKRRNKQRPGDISHKSIKKDKDNGIIKVFNGETDFEEAMVDLILD
ncbi:MAG: hypothetical protein Q4P30_03760 [Eubacteriales bacterium]|nr:hypothetical protein [Eubacteriales bacterium]